MQWAELIAYVSAALLMVMSIPQTVRAYRSGTAGVSVLTWWTIAISIVMWLVYGIRTESTVITIANVASLLATSAALLVITHSRVQRWLVPAIGIAFALIGAILIAMYLPLGVIIGGAVCLPIASRVPQVRNSLSSYRAGERTSVSRVTWILAATGQTGWLIYGLILGDPALIIVNIVCIAMTIMLLSADVANPGNRAAHALATA